MTSTLFRFRVVALSALLILANVCGNFSLSVGVKAAEEGSGFSLLNYLRQPALFFGVALLISALLLRLALLSASEMSLVLPVNAGIAYILTSIAGEWGLRESVRPVNHVGLGLIVAGVVLIGISARSKRLPKGQL